MSWQSSAATSFVVPDARKVKIELRQFPENLLTIGRSNWWWGGVSWGQEMVKVNLKAI
jgi:hypothetical protein